MPSLAELQTATWPPCKHARMKVIRREDNWMLENRDRSESGHEDDKSAQTFSVRYEKDLRTRLRTFPRDAKTWYFLGCHLRMDRRYNEAEAALRKAISLNHAPSHFWSELVLVLQDIGQHDEATKAKARMETQSSKERSLYSVTSSLNKTRHNNELSSSTAEIKDERGMSPCIGCSSHNYYGCNQGEPCGKLIAYRSGASK